MVADASCPIGIRNRTTGAGHRRGGGPSARRSRVSLLRRLLSLAGSRRWAQQQHLGRKTAMPAFNWTSSARRRGPSRQKARPAIRMLPKRTHEAHANAHSSSTVSGRHSLDLIALSSRALCPASNRCDEPSDTSGPEERFDDVRSHSCNAATFSSATSDGRVALSFGDEITPTESARYSLSEGLGSSFTSPYHPQHHLQPRLSPQTAPPTLAALQHGSEDIGYDEQRIEYDLFGGGGVSFAPHRNNLLHRQFGPVDRFADSSQLSGFGRTPPPLGALHALHSPQTRTSHGTSGGGGNSSTTLPSGALVRHLQEFGMECEPLDLSTSPSSGAARPSSGDETFGGLSFSSSAIGCGGRRGGGSLTPQSYTRAADATTFAGGLLVDTLNPASQVLSIQTPMQPPMQAPQHSAPSSSHPAFHEMKLSSVALSSTGLVLSSSSQPSAAPDHAAGAAQSDLRADAQVEAEANLSRRCDILEQQQQQQIQQLQRAHQVHQVHQVHQPHQAQQAQREQLAQEEGWPLFRSVGSDVLDPAPAPPRTRTPPPSPRAPRHLSANGLTHDAHAGGRSADACADGVAADDPRLQEARTELIGAEYGTFMESDAPAPSRGIEATHRVGGMPCASSSLSATWFASHDEDVPLQPQHSSPEPPAHAEVVVIAPTPPKTVHARTQTLPSAGVDVATQAGKCRLGGRGVGTESEEAATPAALKAQLALRRRRQRAESRYQAAMWMIRKAARKTRKRRAHAHDGGNGRGSSIFLARATALVGGL